MTHATMFAVSILAACSISCARPQPTRTSPPGRAVTVLGPGDPVPTGAVRMGRVTVTSGPECHDSAPQAAYYAALDRLTRQAVERGVKTARIDEIKRFDRVGGCSAQTVTFIADLYEHDGPALTSPEPATAPATRTCCKVCNKGKPCGDSCISASKTCRSPPGCAC
jgi:hypothetical protein